MNPVAVILAAGRGTRSGGPKALLNFRGRPWWQTQQDRLERVGIDAIWVVSPAVHQAMTPAPAAVCDAEPDAPMFASVLAGVAEAGSHRGVFILPVDVPASTDRELWRTLGNSPAPAAPSYNGTSGHPIFLPAPWRRVHMSRVTPNDRLDDLLRPHRIDMPVNDPLVACNLNTPQDWEKLQETLGE